MSSQRASFAAAVMLALAGVAVVLANVGSRGSPPAPTNVGFVEMFPGVRVDVARRVIEFDGIVPIDAHNPKTPLVYLETIVCGRDSREHESLVMTTVPASNAHAALLAIGARPGRPGVWWWNGRRLQTIAPTGTPLRVSFRIASATNGDSGGSASGGSASAGTREEPAISWVKLHPSGDPMIEPRFWDSPLWTFGGSLIVTRRGREFYDADMTGQIIGLTTFGGETISFRSVLSPEAAVQEPMWIADAARVPIFGTRVTVVVRVFDPRHRRDAHE
jgi:hypothetical protein